MVLFSLVLIGYASIAVQLVYAQVEEVTGEVPGLYLLLISAISVIGTLVSTTMTSRKHGLEISQAEEEYFINSIKKYVENQYRFLYKEIKSNPEYKYALSQGIVPPELGMKAKKNVVAQLLVNLRSDAFTRTTQRRLQDNLDALIENAVTEFKRERNERCRKLVWDTLPFVIDSVLGNFKTKEEIKQKRGDIILAALEKMNDIISNEDILYPDSLLTYAIQAELNKRL